MTNREWLNSLSNEDFANWCVSAELHDYETNTFKQPSPKLDTIKYSYTQSEAGLIEWLGQERIKVKDNE